MTDKKGVGIVLGILGLGALAAFLSRKQSGISGPVGAINVEWEGAAGFNAAGAILLSNNTYNAKVSVPLSPADMDASVEIFLSKDGGVSKSVSASKSMTTIDGINQISIPVIMPIGGYNYDVFVIIKAAGIILGQYKATTQVSVPSVGTPTVTW